jgi:hypothetical protein
MKKMAFLFVVTVFVMSFPQNGLAQTQKGNWLVEGNIGNFNFTKSNNHSNIDSITTRTESRSMYFSVYPRGAFFVMDNLAVGSTVGFSITDSKDKRINSFGIKDLETKNSYGLFELSPFIRYYFPCKKDKLKFYGQVGGGVFFDMYYILQQTYFNSAGEITSTFKSNTPKKKIGGLAEVMLGVNYFISKQIAVNASLGYQYFRSTQTNSFTTTSSSGNTTNSPDDRYVAQSHRFSWLIGFTYTIPGKSKTVKTEQP